MTAANSITSRRGVLHLRKLWLLIALSMVANARAQPSAPLISQIQIVGNQRVETDAIRVHLSSQVGQPLNDATVDSDVKSIYGMGFFTRVNAYVKREPSGAVVTFVVAEEPLVSEIRFGGMKNISPSDEQVVNAMALHSGSLLDRVRVKTTIRNIAEVYQAKGYLDAKVTSRTVAGANNTVILVFDVDEGPQVQISAVHFVGNKFFTSRQLLGAIQTHPHTFLVSYLFKTGVLDQKKLQEDVDHLTAYYYNEGFLNARVGYPTLTRQGNSLVVTFNITEGPQYHVGTVDLAGNLRVPKAELKPKLTLKAGETFSSTTMQHDVLTLSDFYSDRGYAYVNVDPRTSVDPTTRRVDITYNVSPGREVLVDRINITGNTKTSDKVIRRELLIQEQEPYSTSEIQKSKQRLDALGYFSNTRISTTPGPAPDKIDLDVAVQEANTASLQVGGGYDSYSSVFGNFSIGNTNLFGGGESISASAQIGFLYQNYNISYTEPWFLDMPLSVNPQVFYDKLFLFSFDQTNAGFQLNTGYPLAELGLKKLGPFSLENVTAGLAYQFESVGISGLSQLTTFDILRYKGYERVSEVIPSIRRFTVDNPLDPRSGSVTNFNLELAGLGGTSFVKGLFHSRFFYSYIKSPRWGEWVVSPGVTYGIGSSLGGNKGSELPLYERFFPGGLGGGGDVRGYEIYSLGPQVTLFNQQGSPFGIEQVGGSQELLLSGETTFPILSAFGIRGALFVDAGNSFFLSESPSINKLQAAYGFGIRWKSPFGPIAVDIARPINPRPNDQSTVFDFGAGTPL
ncbi:MAG TPA: outer membrane protein assembly factor BamA [Candidatus Binataceae bacterium]|nr:outer membrane protein assembly factor BamA [Candidatus Binataceae bacterium]